MISSQGDLDELGRALVEEVPDVSAIKKGLAKLPAWMESLRAATVKSLTRKLEDACRRLEAHIASKLAELTEPQDKLEESLLELARNLSEVLCGSKAIMTKVPELVTIMQAAERNLSALEAKVRAAELAVVLEPVQPQQPEASNEQEDALFAFLNKPDVTSRTIDGDDDAVTMLESAIWTLAVAVAATAGCELDATEAEHLAGKVPAMVKLNSCLESMARRI